MDPEIAKSVRAINALIDSLTHSLKRALTQNDELRTAAGDALLRLAREKELLGAALEKSKASRL
jgi:hypothetical protein